MIRILHLLSLAVCLTVAAQTTPVVKKPTVWPASVKPVNIPVSDGAVQRAMWFTPDSKEKKPLLVGLHTWSSTYASAGGDTVYADWCIAQGWAFVHPDFRGPNNTPQALGSDRAVQDIVEAVEWAKKQTAVDESRIYLIGVSGGGHMAMHMAGRHPEIWAGVSAWCGIGDVARWHAEHTKAGKSDRYAQNIEAALGKAPAKDDADAWKRSPESCLANAASVPLDIAHGIHPPIFRATSGNTRVTIFEGGHEIVHQAALNWLSKQRKGSPVVWEIKDFIPINMELSESGK